MDFLEYVRMCQEETDQEKRQEKLCRGLIYKVEAGDTLYSISRRYDLRVRDLMRANPFVNVYNLQIGEELCIPVAANQPVEGAYPYVVRQGDTILSIMNRSGASFEELARLNRGVAGLRLPPGMIILLPSKIQPRMDMEPVNENNRGTENNGMVDGMTGMPGSNEMPGGMTRMPGNNEMPGGMTRMPGNNEMPGGMTRMPGNNGMIENVIIPDNSMENGIRNNERDN